MNVQNPDRVIVLMNLGSPASTAVSDVREYLREFLMDKYVIDYPYPFRYMLVNGIIKMFRAPKSAEAYKKVWLPEGSPLIVLTDQLRDALQEKVNYPVLTMMRYGAPSPQQVFDKITAQYPSAKEVVIVPLYPHWTMSSYETAVVYCREIYNKNNYRFDLKFINPFYNHPKYIEVLANSIRPYLNEDYDKILFSYHGVPQRHLRKDMERKNSAIASKDFIYPQIDYQQQCNETSILVARALGITDSKVVTTFQSRLKSAGSEWIKPYTADVFEQLPAQGKKKILVVCPAFVSDCLETLEEISMEGKHEFMAAGGTSFTYIPCLNTRADWVELLADWVNK